MVGKGRKKVEINLIKDPSSRMVCFSKRRKGLFKKAEELSILSGAKIAVLAFSQAGKLYCSDTKTMDSLLCPQVDNSSEIQRKDDWDSSFAEARAADSLPCLQFEMPSENALDSSFAGAMVEKPFSDDVPTPNSLLCPQLNISTENDAGDGWNYAFTEAMDGNLYCSNAATLNPPLCPQLDIYTEQEEENCGEFDFAAARAADSLLCPQFEMPLENVFDSSFAGAMVEEPFSSDVPTPNSLLCPQLNISTVNDAEDNGWNYAFTEAMDGNLYCSDAATLNPLLCPQFDISTEQEEDNCCWEFDFAEAMAGKEVPFWFNWANI